LMLHFMYYADEVRDFGEVDKGDAAKIKPGELDLADRLIAELSTEKFRPDQYADEYRTRVLAAVEQKVEGHEVTSLAPQAQRTQVIDLMDALKQSLGKRTSSGGSEKTAGAGRAPATLEKKPAAKARREKDEAAPREKKVQGGRR
jgi:DNA end-binding protein Ku